MGIFDGPKDTRTQREKLEAMANQKESPHEAEVAKHLLFKKYGRDRSEKKEPSITFQVYEPGKPGRVVKTQDDVLQAFMRGENARSRQTHVPGGRRQRVTGNEEGGFDLWSYNTVVARRHPDESISITPRRYSVTTSKMMGRLQGMMNKAGYSPSGEARRVRANVPGRWGGWGPAWHSTGWEDLPFIHHHKPKKIDG